MLGASMYDISPLKWYVFHLPVWFALLYQFTERYGKLEAHRNERDY